MTREAQTDENRTRCGTVSPYPWRLKRAYSAWHKIRGVSRVEDGAISLFRSAVGLYPDAPSKLRTVWLPAPLAYSGTSFCHLMATFLPGRRRLRVSQKRSYICHYCSDRENNTEHG
jgi:hypothetical protein